ncbi:hypothetical protein A2662_02065 [Candidatus Giovannonibacteria bacterium RIFCSPHIGHO2_01_FULL_45_33]|nr:MAG: hypothetical protein A2662_02065 [Candidatus Giovannonibacteria bacterium RIFCSPHIGHO2_01_FULL_45_33]OGF70849.1 MAG: hypothetical protein A3C73_00260 [Candidatus Giovannonibacteria bacterium RIFCSPHIGHO2_02_FULL_44_11]
MKESEKNQDRLIEDPNELALFYIQIARKLAEEKLAKDPQAKILEQAIDLMKKHEELLERYSQETNPEIRENLRAISESIGDEATELLNRYEQNRAEIERMYEEVFGKKK